MGKKRPGEDVEAAWVVAVPPQQLESWVAWLVPTFAVANVVAFAYTMYVNDCPTLHTHPSDCIFPALGRFAFEHLKVNHLLGPNYYTLDRLGALDYKKVVEEGEGWSLLACTWLHAGVVHLLANMLSLLFIGVRLEQEFGFVKIGILYTFWIWWELDVLSLDPNEYISWRIRCSFWIVRGYAFRAHHKLDHLCK